MTVSQFCLFFLTVGSLYLTILNFLLIILSLYLTTNIRIKIVQFWLFFSEFSVYISQIWLYLTFFWKKLFIFISWQKQAFFEASFFKTFYSIVEVLLRGNGLLGNGAWCSSSLVPGQWLQQLQDFHSAVQHWSYRSTAKPFSAAHRQALVES